MGTAPALSTVAKAFGAKTADSWTSIQLQNLSEYTGAATKLEAHQYNQMSQIIRSEFGYMKVTELMHFFLLYKSGKYGHFYGSVDPITITCALREFAAERADRISKFEQEEQRRRISAEHDEARKTASDFRRLLNELHLDIPEYLSISNQAEPPLEPSEVEEVYWLFRLGYESENLQSKSSDVFSLMDTAVGFKN